LAWRKIVAGAARTWIVISADVLDEDYRLGNMVVERPVKPVASERAFD